MIGACLRINCVVEPAAADHEGIGMGICVWLC